MPRKPKVPQGSKKAAAVAPEVPAEGKPDGWKDKLEFEIVIDNLPVQVKYEAWSGGTGMMEFRGAAISPTGYHSHPITNAHIYRDYQPQAYAEQIAESLHHETLEKLLDLEKPTRQGRPVEFQDCPLCGHAMRDHVKNSKHQWICMEYGCWIHTERRLK